MHIVDWGIALLFVICVFVGIRQGFFLGIVSLIGLAVAVVVALFTYPMCGAFLEKRFDIPPLVASFGSLTAIFIVIEWLFSFFVGRTLRALRRPLLALPPLRLVDSALGIVPGLINGFLIGGFLIAFFGLFPFSHRVQAAIDESVLGNRLVSLVTSAVPRLEALTGRSSDNLSFFLAQPKAVDGKDLRFPADLELRVDEQKEQRMLELVNDERAKVGLPALRVDPALREAARAHSAEMFRRSYFAHDSAVAGSPADRMKAAGVQFQVAGENIAYAQSLSIAHRGLMNSQGHRENILSPLYTRVGIGVVDAGIYGQMYTQDFAD